MSERTNGLKSIPTKLYGKLQEHIASMITKRVMITDATGLDTEMWMRANRAIHDSAKRMSRILKNSGQGEINLFINTTGQVGGFSLALNLGVCTRPGLTLAYTWYTYKQVWPSGPVPFE